MSRSDTWNTIFRLQAELNLLTFEKLDEAALGHDMWSGERDPTLMSSNVLERWILNYSRAAWHETQELDSMLRGLGYVPHTQLEDAAEEAIDILHFVVSLCILGGVTPDQANKLGSGAAAAYINIQGALRDMRFCLVQLERLTNWKWWSRKKELKRDVLQERIKAAMRAMRSLLRATRLNDEDILRTYQSKHAENERRQKEGYTGRD